MIDKNEILDECEYKINNVEEHLLIYIDERLREIITRLEKLEKFTGIIGKGEEIF